MGGRYATMVAEELEARGVVCFGYPFHPPGKPESLRTAHLETIDVPVLIIQGTRDTFGTKNEAEGYTLSRNIEFEWVEGGDHSLKSSGGKADANLPQAIDAAAAFIERH